MAATPKDKLQSRAQDRRSLAYRIGHELGTGVVIVPITIALLVAAKWIVGELMRRPLQWWGPVMLTVLLVAAGVGLFRPRLWRLTWYAYLEIGVGIFMAWHSASDVWARGGFAWLTAISSVYLLVRGFDNVKKGIEGTDTKRVGATESLGSRLTGRKLGAARSVNPVARAQEAMRRHGRATQTGSTSTVGKCLCKRLRSSTSPV